MNEIKKRVKPTAEETAKIVYILYLIGIVFGITSIIGVIMAYIYRSDAPDWLRSHYQFQIRTFWIGVVYILSGIILALVFVGYLMILFWVFWLIVRCVKGMKSVSQQEAHPNPTGWIF